MESIRQAETRRQFDNLNLKFKWYTGHTVNAEAEDYFLNPPPGSAAARAVEFGIDLTLTLQNLRLTPEERILKLDDHLAGIAWLKANARLIPPPKTSENESR